LVRIDGQQGRLPAQNPDYEEHRQLEPLAGVRQVAIEGLAGQLDVVRSETDQVTVEYSIRLWGDGSLQQLAEAAAVLSEQVASGLVQEGDSVRLAVRRSADLPAGVRGHAGGGAAGGAGRHQLGGDAHGGRPGGRHRRRG